MMLLAAHYSLTVFLSVHPINPAALLGEGYMDYMHVDKFGFAKR